MTVVGTGPEYEAYMDKWVKDHPGPWKRCPRCRSWRLTNKPDGHCPVCPPKVVTKGPR